MSLISNLLALSCLGLLYITVHKLCVCESVCVYVLTTVTQIVAAATYTCNPACGQVYSPETITPGHSSSTFTL